MLEKSIERRLTKETKMAGGLALKFVSPGFDGMPDRVILFPGGRISFVEVKRKDKKPRPLQAARHEMLERLGFKVYVLDDTADIKKIIDETKGGGRP